MRFDTFFKKRGLKMALGGLILGVVVLLYPFFIFGATILIDSFDTYNVGNLNGQGDWFSTGTGEETYYVEVNDIDKIDGTKSIRWGNISRLDIMKVGDEINSGSVSFWFQIEILQDDQDSTSHGFFYMPQGWQGANRISLSYLCDWTTHYCSQGVQIRILGETFTELGVIEPNTWVNIQIEWSHIDNQYRANLDFNGWSEWKNTAAELDYLDTIRFYRVGTAPLQRIWVDKISESDTPPCKIGNCKYCSTYDACINAGCYWDYEPYYYALFGQSGFCVEPYVPEEEECGDFYKCQFCLTQETCEISTTCEWVDRGLGEKCYMKLPEIPPEQVEWEAPELEDCSALSGVEKWLCEIKNFIAGIFMPSQEALENLQNTLGSFKNRFPFNYISALTSFFTDVKTSLDEEKEIPIKILGQESNVSFSFWEKTAMIGGVSETFKNILIDFTSLIIFMGWFMWLISFIQRFF